MKIRTLIISVSLLLMSVMGISCNKTSVQEDAVTYKIGFSQCADDLWRQIMMVQMEAEVAKHPDLRLLTKVAKNDTEEQVKQINDDILI